ncbi:MerR family transcriptional regulator [Vagococcus carniphilus]|uniref:MerR family transcriptional regulator n=1 Tax=Vagococcus carniphilus TaxID=218144 RepID=UPI003BA8EE90
MFDKLLTIGEIAKLFNLPTSKIRYWEAKELFTPKRNNSNDYRIFNIQTFIELLEVNFYRNLNVPIKQMKNFNKIGPESTYSILKNTEKDIEKELINLKKQLVGIEKRKKQLEDLFLLKKVGYSFEQIDIKKIVPLDMTKSEDVQIQLEHLSNFILYKEIKSDNTFHLGISVMPSYQYSKEVLWEQSSIKKNYVTCLIECCSEDFEKNNLKIHIDYLKKKVIKLIE